MQTWIISECDALVSSIRNVLARLEVDCPLSRVVSSASVDELAASFTGPGQVVFLATAALSADHFDLLRRLRGQTNGELVVVSSIPEHAIVLQAIRAGASDYLNADGQLDEELEGCISRIRLDHGQQTPKGRLITIVPCHAPSDASLLAVNFAAVIAQRAGSCGLLDFHLRGGDLALLLKIAPRHTVIDLLKSRQNIDEAMFQQALFPHESGIRLLAGPELFSDLRNIDPNACQRILTLAQASHPVVVVNSEDVVHAEQVKALASSERIVLTMRLDLVSLYRAKQHLEFMTRNRVSMADIDVVAMGVGNSGELPVKTVRSVLNITTVHCVPDDRCAITMSINVGNPVVLESPKSKTSKALVAFADALLGCSSKTGRSEGGRQSALAKAAAMLALNTLSYVK